MENLRCRGVDLVYVLEVMIPIPCESSCREIIAIGELRISPQGFQLIISSWNCMNGLHGLLQSFGPNDIYQESSVG
jgi:hypothetical protein